MKKACCNNPEVLGLQITHGPNKKRLEAAAAAIERADDYKDRLRIAKTNDGHKEPDRMTDFEYDVYWAIKTPSFLRWRFKGRTFINSFGIPLHVSAENITYNDNGSYTIKMEAQFHKVWRPIAQSGQQLEMRPGDYIIVADYYPKTKSGYATARLIR